MKLMMTSCVLNKFINRKEGEFEESSSKLQT
jgi:hypothetical protein